MADFWKEQRILLTGGGGFLGTAIAEKLRGRGVPKNHIIIPRSRDYDLREKAVVSSLVRGADMVIHCAAAVGGIQFQRENPAKVFYDNVAMALFLVDEAWRQGVKKFVGVGSIVEHPAESPFPLREENIWNGCPDVSNSAYALAKRSLLAASQFYRFQYGFNAIHLLPVKLYGPGMRFGSEAGQVIAMLIDKIARAKKEHAQSIEGWGTGNATREFLYVDDAAEAILLAAEKYNDLEPVHVGSGIETSIRDLADLLMRLMTYDGVVHWNSNMPEGQLRSVADVEKAKQAFGFTAATPLEEGLRKTVSWFLEYQKLRSPLSF